jgi:hypothetical protein
MEVAWCGVTSGAGVPIVTTSDGAHDAIVWAVGTEGLDPNGSGTIPGDGRLHGFDGDTGEILAGAPQADAGASDAGVSDAGVSDAGSDEAGAAEAGVSDAGPPEGTMSGARRYIAPIVAKGRLYVATDGHLYAWRP